MEVLSLISFWDYNIAQAFWNLEALKNQQNFHSREYCLIYSLIQNQTKKENNDNKITQTKNKNTPPHTKSKTPQKFPVCVHMCVQIHLGLLGFPALMLKLSDLWEESPVLASQQSNAEGGLDPLDGK